MSGFFAEFRHPVQREQRVMKKRSSEAQIAFALRLASSGTPVAA
jgi:hypothetical protein